MRVLRSIVQVAALAVFDVWHQRALRYAVAAELVGDEDPCSATIWMEGASIKMDSATTLDGMIVAVD